MATMLAPSRKKVLGHAIAASSTVSLPGFLVPAWQSRRHNFSTTTARPSKLGRTPISVPPGVELTIGEPWTKKDMTSYKREVKKTITVKGPLGTFCYGWV